MNICSICERPYSEHSGDRCAACGDPVEHHDAERARACWQGRARMAKAKRESLGADLLNDVDRQALALHPDPPSCFASLRPAVGIVR